jgi:PhnB protein
MAVVNPYLTFDGNCEEAFNFYESVFGGKLGPVMRFSEMPQGDAQLPDEIKNRVMHVALPMTGRSVLMGSDSCPGFGPPLNAGNNFTVSVGPEDEDDARRIFDGLAAGGTVTMPLEKAFWGALFGMLTDKFGIQWMVNYDYGQKG